MGTNRDLGGQTGGHILKFFKNEKYTFSSNSSVCSLKQLVRILFKGIICYHLLEVVIEVKV